METVLIVTTGEMIATDMWWAEARMLLNIPQRSFFPTKNSFTLNDTSVYVEKPYWTTSTRTMLSVEE